MKNQYPKVGDFLSAKKDTAFHKHFGRVEGIVTEVKFWDKPEEMNSENHGTLEIELTRVGKMKSSSVGELEHFSLYGWDEIFQIKDKE